MHRSCPKLLKKSTSFFHCPYCELYVSTDLFEDHCSQFHQLPTQDHCIWCLHYQSSYSTHTTLETHSYLCYHTFLHYYRPPMPILLSLDTPTLFDLQPLGPTCDYMGHAAIDQLPHNPLWEFEPPLTGLTYQNDHLNLAVACLQWYLNSRETSEVFHLMIRPPAFSSFLKLLDAHHKHLRTLPFSCLCTGGGKPHRHLLLVCTPSGHFIQHLWKAIKCRNKNNNIRSQRIDSPWQFLMTLGSVSQTTSSCHFAFDTPGIEGDAEHYYLHHPLPTSYQHVLASQWEGGLLELIYHQYAYVEPHLLAPVAVSFQGLWGVKVRDLPGIPTQGVLPVSPCFIPTSEPTENFVHLLHGEKLYFERTEEVPTDWVQVQADRGNRVYQRIGEALYYPTPYQQRHLTSIKPFVDQILRLETQLAEKESTWSALQGSLDAIESTHHVLERKYALSERRLKTLQRKHIDSLERENEALRKKRKSLD